MTAPYFAAFAAQPNVTDALWDWYRALAVPNTAYVIQKTAPETIPEIVREYVGLSGLTIDNAKFFGAEPGFLTLIHKDADGRKCALNIPVDVPQTPGVGMMYWFETLPHWRDMVHKTGDDVWLRMPGPEPLEVSDRKAVVAAEHLSNRFVKGTVPTGAQQLLTPSVHSVENWHRVDNTQSTTTRLIFSIRFVENPVLDEIADRFRKIKAL